MLAPALAADKLGYGGWGRRRRSPTTSWRPRRELQHLADRESAGIYAIQIDQLLRPSCLLVCRNPQLASDEEGVIAGLNCVSISASCGRRRCRSSRARRSWRDNSAGRRARWTG